MIVTAQTEPEGMEEGRDVLEIGVGLGISAGTSAAGPAAGIALAEVYVL